ncbi:MAG: copper-binding protein [Polaromonas sp.]|uniref:copper-binding protein n=1 Tax=Polaromonas sp. TaxID=1869339 RepID=UPI002733D4C5|nr:copper-binding protein [Polaromonas sp.]MDP3797366.1 copper-binding protein [Polaromonas sp.]
MKKQLFTTFALVSALSASAAMAQQKMDDMKGTDMAKKPAVSTPITHMAKGTVKKIDAKTGWVLMAHEPVNSMNWPAMTMSFKAKDKSLLDKLAVDKKVDFGFVKEGEDYLMTIVK